MLVQCDGVLRDNLEVYWGSTLKPTLNTGFNFDTWKLTYKTSCARFISVLLSKSSQFLIHQLHLRHDTRIWSQYMYRAVVGCIFCYVYFLCLIFKNSVLNLTFYLHMGLITEFYDYYYYFCWCYYHKYKATSTSASVFSNKTGGFILFNMICCLNLYNNSTCYFTWGLKLWQLYCWKIEVLWNVTQCWLINSYRRFITQECLDIQGHAVQ